MNYDLLQQDLLEVNNAISHSGVPGMHWYKHDSGLRWQKQAKYAHGMDDPKAKNGRKFGGDTEHPKTNGTAERSKPNGIAEHPKSNPEATVRIAELQRVPSKEERGRADIQRNLTDIRDSKQMSTEDIVRRTNALKAENEYQREIQNRMRNEINLLKLEKEYSTAFKDPVKKSFYRDTFEKARNGVRDAVIQKASEAAGNFVVSFAYNAIKNKYGEDVAKGLYKSLMNNSGGGNKNKKHGKNNQQQQQQQQQH